MGTTGRGEKYGTRTLFAVSRYVPTAAHVVGERITVLAPSAATQGYEVFLQQGEEGSGPPPHCHGWDESFYITKGAVEIGYGDQVVTATVGTFVHVPAALSITSASAWAEAK